MDYTNPLVLLLSDKPSGAIQGRENTYRINTANQWQQYTQSLNELKKTDYDSVIVQYDKSLSANPQALKSLDIHTAGVVKAFRSECPVVTIFDGKAYRLDANYSHTNPYVAPNDTVTQKYESYGSKDNWQHHQAEVWDRFRSISELSDGSYGENHVAILTAENRGLTKNDLEGFFTIRHGKVLNPSLLQDDLVGMPGVKAYQYDDVFYHQGKPLNTQSLAFSMMGNGYAIPMRNHNGDMAKFQIGMDVNRYNVTLKASAADGVTVQSSELYDKKKQEYLFQLEDGSPSKLHVVDANNQQVTFEDVKGQFKASLKQDIRPILDERGYQMPEIVDKLKVLPRSKYAWSAPGNMVGAAHKTLDVPKLVSPSEAGFIPVREPLSPDAGYTVLVVEGALKGHIVATYLEKEEMKPFTDAIADQRGLIVAQVPGVSQAFIDSVLPIQQNYDIKDAVIAMDADGRFNRSVARGIHNASASLSQIAPVRVMSWNPEQKGLDDAVIALHRQQITMDDFDLTFGTAKELFPLAQASPPNPYKLDGTRANRLNWQIEYDQSKTHRTSESLFHQAMPVLKQTSPEEVSKIEDLRKQDVISDEDLLDFVNEVYALQEEIKSKTSSFVGRFQ